MASLADVLNALGRLAPELAETATRLAAKLKDRAALLDEEANEREGPGDYDGDDLGKDGHEQIDIDGLFADL
jgi:hypothetical protein